MCWWMDGPFTCSFPWKELGEVFLFASLDKFFLKNHCSSAIGEASFFFFFNTKKKSNEKNIIFFFLLSIQRCRLVPPWSICI